MSAEQTTEIDRLPERAGAAPSDRIRIGELFAGYGGLGMGVQAALGGEVAWYSDVCKFDDDGTVDHHDPHRGACKILAHRFPGVPNLGDVSTIDWSQVEPVDILTGGSPCQDLSHAGRRAGMTEGTRSNLWVAMREAIAQLRPSLVVWENVRGAFSAEADSAVEPCPGCVGDGSGVSLRALGRVLGDLSDLGYDCRWHGLRAADVGAPHGRFRVFVVAEDAQREGRGAAWDAAPGQAAGGRTSALPGRPGGVASLLPTPVTGDADRTSRAYDRGNPTLIGALLPTPGAIDGGGGPKRIREDGRTEADHGPALRDVAVTLLPTPAVNDMGEGKTVERWDEWTADMQAKHGNGNGHGKSLAIEAQRLLPTPTTRDHKDHTIRREPHRPDAVDPLSRALTEWGDYAHAIAQWESIVGRPAPAPTMTSAKGNPQLAPAFVEWMMGLPDGWVTDVPGITRNEALKALGNGVVPQQCTAALREMFAWEVAAA